MTASVLIVGAGPSGLVLALSLLQNGVSVRIIDKEVSYRVGERGIGTMPRTIEVHNILGTHDDVLKKASILPKHRVYELPGGIKPLLHRDMAIHVEPTPQVPYPNVLVLGQNHLEAILRSHIRKYGVEVELGTSLQKFDQDGDFVVAYLVKTTGSAPGSETAKFSWLVGADGARSVVRKQLNLSFLGETLGNNMIIGDIAVKEGLDREFWHFWGDAKSKLVSLRPSGQDRGIFSFFIMGDGVNYDMVYGRNEFITVMQEISDRKDIVFGDLVWINIYRPNVRMVDRFHVGRVFLVGDAAHCHTPAGGQGMNSSIQDSFNLGWKLALVEKGFSPRTLLDTYDKERLPIITYMLKKTTEVLQKTMKPKNEKDKEDAWKREGELDMLGVNYRSSSIVFDDDVPERTVGAAYNSESASAARAGDRAPDAPGLVLRGSSSMEETSLFQLFKSNYHTLLIFGGLPEDHKQLLSTVGKVPSGLVKTVLILSRDVEQQTVAEGFDIVAVDGKGFARDGYYITDDQVKFVAVRPDGIVGARVGNAANMAKYFSMIFN